METKLQLKTKKRKSRLIRIAFIPVATFAVILIGLEGWIRFETNHCANDADKQFAMEKTKSLIALIESPEFTLKQKNRAIWVLGELKSKEALPKLESMLTGKPCHHETEICQYELKKAILKMKGEPRWKLNAKKPGE